MAKPKIITCKYYNGDTELLSAHAMRESELRARYPESEYPRRALLWIDSFSVRIGTTIPNASGRQMLDTYQPVTRMIRYNEAGSKHKCDNRCRGAKGGDCECSCGGANHGADRAG